MIHYISYFDFPWRNERNVADALAWHGYDIQCYQVTDPRDRPGCNGAPAVKPRDIVFTSVPHCIPVVELQRYKDAGARLVCWYFDWLWGLGNREAEYLPRLLLMDAVFGTDGFDDAEYRARGVNCRHWLPQAAMPEDRLLLPRFGTPVHDVVFMGHTHTSDRQEMCSRLRTFCNFANYGSSIDGRRIWGYEMVSICQNAAIMVGTNYRNDVPGYWSDRIYVVSGAGGFYLGQYVPGIERQFKDGVHCGFFDGFEGKNGMEAKVKYWLNHSVEREACRRRGHALIHEKHIYTHRVGEMLDTLRRLQIVR